MNQSSANSCFINNSSAEGNLSPLVTPDPKQAPPPDASLPRPVGRRPEPLSKKAARKAASNKNDDRCRHYTDTGRRCRLVALDPSSGLCFRHVSRQFHPTDEDLSSAFVGLLSGFQSPSRIHAFLTQLTVLLVQNRVSTRRAAILAYLGQTLLRTLPAINDELNPADEPQPFTFGLRRPKRDDPVDPETAAFYQRLFRCKGSGALAELDSHDRHTSNPDNSK